MCKIRRHFIHLYLCYHKKKVAKLVRYWKYKRPEGVSTTKHYAKAEKITILGTLKLEQEGALSRY